MTSSADLSWLIFIPAAASPLVYLVGRMVVRLRGDASGANPARWLALLALLADLFPLYLVGQQLQIGHALAWKYGMVQLTMDGIAFLMATVTLALAILVTAFSSSYMRSEVGEEKFYALLIAMTAMMIGLVSAADLFNLWVWFEAMAITSIMLVAFYREQPASLEAGFKYLVQSATGSILVLIGIGLVFATTGSLSLVSMSSSANWNGLILAAGALFVVGFGVKIALVPMHTWLPDAHSQAPSGISAMLSGVVIETGLVALLRVLYPFSTHPERMAIWGVLLLGFAAVNMLVGNLMALRQTQIKRLLAYSSLSHVGYILLGVGVALVTGQAAGAAGGFFHVITHAAMKGLAFLSAGALLYGLRLSRGDHGPLVLDDLNGASRRYPLPAFALSLAVLALGGLPPLAGFMSKWQIFVAGFETGNSWIIALVLFAALNSVLSLAYYAPLVNRLYRRETGELVQSGGRITFAMAAPLAILAGVILLLGVWPSLADGMTSSAAHSIIFGLH